MLTKQEKVEEIKNFFKKTIMDKGVNKLTLGKEFEHINPELLQTAAAKLVKINKGEAEPDDRDNLLFSSFHGLEDFMKHAIQLDQGKLQVKAKVKMDGKKNLSGIDSGFFSPQIRSTIVGSTFAQHPDSGNPQEIFHTSNKITRMGQGSIGSSDAIPEESRKINDSSFGLIDFAGISEDLNIGITTYLSHGTRKGEDNKLYKCVYDKNGKPVWIDHEELLKSNVEIPDHQ